MYDLNLKYKYNRKEINIFYLTQGKLISKLYQIEHNFS